MKVVPVCRFAHGFCRGGPARCSARSKGRGITALRTGAGAVHPVKPLKDVGQLVFLDANSVVGDGEGTLGLGQRGPYHHLAPLPAISNAVSNEVDQQLGGQTLASIEGDLFRNLVERSTARSTL